MDVAKKSLKNNPVEEITIKMRWMKSQGPILTNTLVYLSEWQRLAEKGRYKFDDKKWFICSAPNLSAEVGISISTCKTIINRLIKDGLLIRKRKSNRYFFHFKSEEMDAYLMKP